MKLRSKDIKLAKSTKYLSYTTNPNPREAQPSTLLAYAEKRLKSMGYKIKDKRGPKGWKYKRMSTTLRKTIWRGVGWEKKKAVDQAATMMHELAHAEQSQGYGFKRWIALYIGSARFRFAMEAQAYRETVRAYRAMGVSEKTLRDYADDLPNRFIKSYWILGRRMRKDVRKRMAGIVLLP